jgi:integrase
MAVANFSDLDNTCLLIISRFPVGSSQNSVLNFVYNTGCRIEEAIQLERITLGATTFTVDTEKKSLNRTFALSLLPPNYLNFLPVPASPLARKTLSSYTSIVRAILLNADRIYYKNTNDILSNVFRYRYVRYLQEQGYSFSQIKQDMGHISNQSTASYLADVFY